MKENKITRRDFIKSLGLAGATLPAVSIVGRIGGDELLRSEDYGGFLIRRRASDNPPYEVDESIYQRFRQKNTMFSRVIWDERIQESEAPYANVGKERMAAGMPGFTRLDYAIYTAAWTVALANGSAMANGAGNGGLFSWEGLGGFVASNGLYGMGKWDGEGFSQREISDIVKLAAKFYGASMAGIAEVDERWFYSHRYTRFVEPKGVEAPIQFDDVDQPKELEDRTLILPKSMNRVIALAFEMDYDGISTYVSGPGAAATGNGYSRMAFTASCLAEFIRALGYQAVPTGNDTALSIPISIDAGLGELGRMGLLVTPKYGPRVRLAKVFTDMPLDTDSPISFGVEEFCEICGKCADDCPGGAIPTGRNAQRVDGINDSSNPGVKKWYVDCEKCHLVWAQEGMDCSKCVQVCPFNKPEGWLHDVTRGLIGMKSGAVDQALLALDDASTYGEKTDPRDFWKKDTFIHIRDA